MIQEHSEQLNIGEMVLHHTADAWTIDLEPITTIHLPRFADIHVGGMTLNLSPTKHVVFMILAAVLVALTMWIAARAIDRHRRNGTAPKGFANAVEAMVLYVRNDIAIANIGHDGAKFAPFILVRGRLEREGHFQDLSPPTAPITQAFVQCVDDSGRPPKKAVRSRHCFSAGK